MEKHNLSVLWVANNSVSSISKCLGFRGESQYAGWLQGMFDEVLQHDDIALSFCYPYEKEVEGVADGVRYFTVSCQNYENKDLYARFLYILKEVKPDIVHIYGTEMFFLRWFTQKCIDEGLCDRTVVWIQGLKFVCANRNTDGISLDRLLDETIYERLGGYGLRRIRKELKKDGIEEVKLIRRLKSAFVRTDWDKAICISINPRINIYECNEILRLPFYEDSIWNLNAVERHSVFVSQYYAALKGFHMVLDAIGILKNKYPDITLYVTGQDLYNKKTGIKNFYKKTTYEEILKEKIKKYGLKERVKFLGKLNDRQMKDRYLRSHVFVSASSIENSPNSVCEAMMLGTPVVASYVGGIASLIEHKKEGLLYPFYETEMLAYYISSIFDDDELALKFSIAARKKAMKNHNRANNYNCLLKCYKEIVDKAK